MEMEISHIRGYGKLSDLVPLEWSSGGDIISQYDKDDIVNDKCSFFFPL